MHSNSKLPTAFTAFLVFADGKILRGKGIGAQGASVGEVCFNTSMTGYQEILTDPSYAGQIIAFTFPHIGNVGTNLEDLEADIPAVQGAIFREDITDPSNWRSRAHLDDWLRSKNVIGICGVDTRELTRLIRDNGAPSAAIYHGPNDSDGTTLENLVASWPGLAGMDLAKLVTTTNPYVWSQTSWKPHDGFGEQAKAKYHVVAVDFGAKKNILRCLSNVGCKITVLPADATSQDILSYRPDGVFLTNGPGDPSATAEYAVPMIRELLKTDLPIFGICLGHQLLALALGAKTEKMHLGHRGANHPVKDLKTGRVEITSQNHGFVVTRGSLPSGVIETHHSLFDGSIEGISLEGKAVFSVQYHPEASPGPQDSHYLFERFASNMDPD
jgi:carbamoyl-phosphate synthase small subunit